MEVSTCGRESCETVLAALQAELQQIISNRDIVEEYYRTATGDLEHQILLLEQEAQQALARESRALVEVRRLRDLVRHLAERGEWAEDACKDWRRWALHALDAMDDAALAARGE